MWPIVAIALLIHGDVRFPPDEQLLIHQATTLLYEQTSGALSIDVVFDFDGEPYNTIPTLTRVPEWDERIDALDKAAHARVLGWTIGKQMNLVPARLLNDPVFVHVVMHEILHSLGVPHVNDPRAIMYPWAYSTVNLTRADFLVMPFLGP